MHRCKLSDQPQESSVSCLQLEHSRNIRNMSAHGPEPVFRILTVESKMPDAWIVVDGFPSRHPGKKCIHYNKFLGLVRKLSGIGIRNHVVVPLGESISVDRKELNECFK